MVTTENNLAFQNRILRSFDGTTNFNTSIYRPDRFRDLKRLVNDLSQVSFRGAGLSYALASASPDCPTIELSQFNRLLEFDSVSGRLKVESGICLATALEWSVAHGWNIGVLPGYPAITVGGCVAFNVHGKSQFATGNFENIVEELTLYHPDHGELKCSRQENADLFWLTIGGFGLTGLILDVTLRLTKLKGSQIERSSVLCDNLEHAFEQMIELEGRFDYIYSWNNCCRSKAQFGRGVVYAEKFIGDPSTPSYGRLNYAMKEVGSRPGLAVFRRESAPIINTIYEIKERLLRRPLTMDIGPATFPIAGKEFYFSMIGKPGFHEYQCIFPRKSVADALRKLENIVSRFRIHPSLASTKFFKGSPRHLCFQQDGYCLALDVPNAGHKDLLKFIAALDDLVIDCGGVVNIAKDSRLPRDAARKMYPGYDMFWTAIHTWDPLRRFTNSVRSRLEPL